MEVYTPSCRGSPKTLAMKNWTAISVQGPLTKGLFWEAMQNISSQTTLVAGHPWPELKDMIHEQMQTENLMAHAVPEVSLRSS